MHPSQLLVLVLLGTPIAAAAAQSPAAFTSLRWDEGRWVGGSSSSTRTSGQTAAIQVVGDTVALASPNGRSYRWIRTGTGEWRAELGRATYLMKRIGR
jgi:hypothetical protein